MLAAIDWWLWLSIATTILLAIASGTIHLTEMIPEAYQKRVSAWCGFLAFCNQTVLVAFHVVNKGGLQ
jgi:hypothetical protein